MNRFHLVLGAALSCGLASVSSGQAHQVAFDWQAGQGGHDRLDTAVAASASRVVVVSNQQIVVLTRGGLLKDLKKFDDNGYPFESISPSGFPFDGRADYDRYSGRLWMVMQVDGLLSVAVSKDSSPDTLGSADWHIYTGVGTGSDAFNFQLISTARGTPYMGYVDFPAISFGPEHIWITSVDLTTSFRQGIVAIPRMHGGSMSILEGDRPSEADHLYGLSPAVLPDPPLDPTALHFPVQELYESVAEGQFFVSEPEETGLAPFHRDAVRLGGAYFDQSGDLQYQWVDVTLPSGDDYFRSGTDQIWPRTPKQDWIIKPTATPHSQFDSGVLARDVNGALKLFTAHHVLVSSGGTSPEPEEQTEFRWYVIDPDLADFPGANWSPSIEVVGRAPTGSVTNAETYNGAISVNPLGAAYITFTRSGASGTSAWPSLVRAKLSANYATVLFELPSSDVQGPQAWYADEQNNPVSDLGSDYADMQADYVHCGVWTTGAVVGDPGDTIAPSHTRETWVTEIQVDCNNAEMNGDGIVDSADLALYLDYYAQEDQRADMDRSGTITAVDYMKYSNEYAGR